MISKVAGWNGSTLMVSVELFWLEIINDYIYIYIYINSPSVSSISEQLRLPSSPSSQTVVFS